MKHGVLLKKAGFAASIPDRASIRCLDGAGIYDAGRGPERSGGRNEGTEFELFGDALPAAMVLSFVAGGIPMSYNGQESGNPRRLRFFEKDPIAWRTHSNDALYANIIALKKNTSALWNGEWGAMMVHVPNDKPAQVLSFVRRDDNGKVFAVFNLSAKPQTVRFEQTLCHDRYIEHFSN